MNIDILITQVDEHNEFNILATKRFNPNDIQYYRDQKWFG